MTGNRASLVEFEKTSCTLCNSDSGSIIARSRDYEYETTEKEICFVRCSECGHVYMTPRPTQGSAHLIYPGNYYTLGDQGSKLSDRIIHRLKTIVLKYRVRDLVASLPSNAAVLEAGAGDAALSIAISEHRPDLEVTALDLQFSDNTKARLHQLNISAIESPLETADLDRKYDLIIMNQLIEHLWQPTSALKRLHRHTRPGGLISISTPSTEGYDRKWFSDGTWGGYYAPRHLNLFSPDTLNQLLNGCGFRVISSKPLTAPLVWVRNCSYSLKSGNHKLASFFYDENLLAVGLFFIIDRLAIALGKPTSNQQVIAERQ